MKQRQKSPKKRNLEKTAVAQQAAVFIITTWLTMNRNISLKMNDLTHKTMVMLENRA